MITREIIELTEYETVTLDENSISQEIGEHIWKNYSSQVSIEFPSPKTHWQWFLRNQGWVGYIPVSDELLFFLKPRVPLKNIFRMLEYAYNLKSIYFFPEEVQCDSLKDFFNILAGILAKRVLGRAKKGFYKAYQDKNEILPFISGRIDINEQLKEPLNIQFSCHYQEYTPDITDNQILLWTLYVIIRSGLCTMETLQLSKKAFRSLEKSVRLTPFTAQQCYKRIYNRLNLEYQPMHNLCWFFLEHCGPKLAAGKHSTIPFMVNMPRLYELFVAQWLKSHLPQELELKIQERVNIDGNSMLYFNIDLVIYEKDSSKAICVLDTKYKINDSISPGDFAQVVTYALAKKCPEAVLIYPGENGNEFYNHIQNIRVRSLSFNINGDIEEAGKSFLKVLLGLDESKCSEAG